MTVSRGTVARVTYLALVRAPVATTIVALVGAVTLDNASPITVMQIIRIGTKRVTNHVEGAPHPKPLQLLGHRGDGGVQCIPPGQIWSFRTTSVL